MVIDTGAAAAAVVGIAKRSPEYRALRPRVLSPVPIEAWVETGGLGFVGFALRPIIHDRPGSHGFLGGLVAFAVDLLGQSVLGAQTAELDATGRIVSEQQLVRVPELFALAFAGRRTGRPASVHLDERTRSQVFARSADGEASGHLREDLCTQVRRDGVLDE